MSRIYMYLPYVTAAFLVDTSALVRVHRHPQLRATWRARAQAGLIAVCPLIELELLALATTTADRVRIVGDLHELCITLDMPDGVYARAAEVQAILTERGQNRSAGPIDLLVAATAELKGLTVLHYDGDFDVIKRATGQPTQWLAPPGSLR